MNVFGIVCVIWVACGIAAWLAVLYRYPSRFTPIDALAIMPAMLSGPIALAMFGLGVLQDHQMYRRP